MGAPISLRDQCVAVETAYGAATTPTRRLYGLGHLNPQIALHSVSLARNSLCRTLDVYKGQASSAFTFGGALCLQDLPLWWTWAIRGGVVPTISAGIATWVFTPERYETRPSACWHWQSPNQTWRGPYAMLSKFTLSGAAGQSQPVMLDSAWVCQPQEQITFANPVHAPRTYSLPAQNNVYLNRTAESFGQTRIPGALLNWSLSFDLPVNVEHMPSGFHGWRRAWRGVSALNGGFTFQTERGLAEELAFEGAQERLVRLVLYGTDTVINPAVAHGYGLAPYGTSPYGGVSAITSANSCTIDLFGIWTASVIGEDGETSTFQLSLRETRNPTGDTIRLTVRTSTADLVSP